VPFTLSLVRDEVLLGRLRAGDRRALAAVYDQHGGMVYGLACSVTGDAALAESITADLFVDLWQHPEVVEGSVRAHLAGVAHRRSVEVVRHQEGDGRRPQGHQVAELLDRLPDDQRSALVLAYFDGRTAREVAELLEIGEHVAVRCLHDALRALRGHLGGDLGART
jgi:RNA polymerase sigma-70 factor (ECF subfamily)